MVRIRGDMKVLERKSDKKVTDDAQSRNVVENSLRTSQETITDLQKRMIRFEEKVEDERSAVTALVQHVKAIEQNMLGMQQELLSRRGDTGNK